MPLILAVWWWLHPDYMAVAGASAAVLTLVLAGWVAWRQFRLMERQTDIMEEQKSIAEKQGQIAETQHWIMQEQMLRRSRLSLRAPDQKRNRRGDEWIDITTVTLDVVNTGTKAANGFYWEVLLGDWHHFVEAVDGDDRGIMKKWSPFSKTESYHKLSGHYSQTLFPRSSVVICKLDMNVAGVPMADITLRWRLTCEDEIVPAEGFTDIRLTLGADRFYKITLTNPRYQS